MILRIRRPTKAKLENFIVILVMPNVAQYNTINTINDGNVTARAKPFLFIESCFVSITQNCLIKCLPKQSTYKYNKPTGSPQNETWRNFRVMMPPPSSKLNQTQKKRISGTNIFLSFWHRENKTFFFIKIRLMVAISVNRRQFILLFFLKKKWVLLFTFFRDTLYKWRG